VSSQDEARGREVAEARRQGGKAATARRHGGTAATALGGGVSDDAGRGCWAVLDSVGGRRGSERGAVRARRGVQGLSGIWKGVFYKMSATSVISGRREYYRY
jgi:hypothetical protein